MAAGHAAHTRFGDLAALFTDAAMSVKTPQPYCRLGLEASKTPFFTDAACS